MQILPKMKQNNYSEMIFDEDDVCDLIMQGREIASFQNMIVDASVDLEKASMMLDDIPALIKHNTSTESIQDFDRRLQNTWHMPEQYRQLDIAQHILDYVPLTQNYRGADRSCCYIKNATCLTYCVF